ncbi:MAG: hypothetical protein LUF27_15600 [Lachnospiraceae bacterium]|nr:hypothetical protein [Lachnospiraceae bacterium]
MTICEFKEKAEKQGKRLSAYAAALEKMQEKQAATEDGVEKSEEEVGEHE